MSLSSTPAPPAAKASPKAPFKAGRTLVGMAPVPLPRDNTRKPLGAPPAVLPGFGASGPATTSPPTQRSATQPLQVSAMAATALPKPPPIGAGRGAPPKPPLPRAIPSPEPVAQRSSDKEHTKLAFAQTVAVTPVTPAASLPHKSDPRVPSAPTNVTSLVPDVEQGSKTAAPSLEPAVAPIAPLQVAVPPHPAVAPGVLAARVESTDKPDELPVVPMVGTRRATWIGLSIVASAAIATFIAAVPGRRAPAASKAGSQMAAVPAAEPARPISPARDDTPVPAPAAAPAAAQSAEPALAPTAKPAEPAPAALPHPTEPAPAALPHPAEPAQVAVAKSAEPSSADATAPADLEPGFGHLTVHSTSPHANVYVMLKKYGPVEETLAIPCGKRFIAIGIPLHDRKEPVWLAPGKSTEIPCGGSLEMTINPRRVK